MSKEESYTINIRPKWVFLIKEYSQQIQTAITRINDPAIPFDKKQQFAKIIENAEKDLLKIAKIADIILDAFDEGKTHITFSKDKGGKIISETNKSVCIICNSKFVFATVEDKEYCENCINTLDG